RRRIALTMRLDEQPGESNRRGAPASAGNGQPVERNARGGNRGANQGNHRAHNGRGGAGNSAGNSAMSDVLAAALGKKR
ncbi:MAG: hypothetical protein ACRDAV_09555, partial [Plesiomonas shigelloides]